MTMQRHTNLATLQHHTKIASMQRHNNGRDVNHGCAPSLVLHRVLARTPFVRTCIFVE
jgi:hypothetical protein